MRNVFVLSHNHVAQVKIRGRSLQCEACGDDTALSRKQFQDFDYEKFTQSPLFTVFLIFITSYN